MRESNMNKQLFKDNKPFISAVKTDAKALASNRSKGQVNTCCADFFGGR